MWGNSVRISIFGESHGPSIGVVMEGIPSGFILDMEQIAAHMARRAPGQMPWSTKRSEKDEPVILSGMYLGKTTGTPLCAMIKNTDTHSSDYSALADKPRPGHADLTGLARYNGANDPRGGGHFSGRIMAPLTFAGAVCMQILASRGVQIHAHIYEIAGIMDTPYDPLMTPKSVSDKPFPVMSDTAEAQMIAAIMEARDSLDSVGGIIECMATGFPAGLGKPIFDNIESRIASLLFGIPAIKGVEFGRGFAVSGVRGSENNDSPSISKQGIRLQTNHAGGIEGGISNGMPILLRCACKPTPSISRPQDTINLKTMQNDTIQITGRHDPCIVPRAVPIVESAVALALLDLMEEG